MGERENLNFGLCLLQRIHHRLSYGTHSYRKQVAGDAKIHNFDFNLEYSVNEFHAYTLETTGNVFKEFNPSTTTGSKFTPDQLKFFANLKSGQRLFIDNIKAVGPDGKSRELNSIAFKIN